TIQRIVHVGVMFWIRKCAHTKMVQLMLYYMINGKLMNTEMLDYLNKAIKNYNLSSMLFLISLVCMTSNITCLTTGFCLWCQLAFSTYLQHPNQPHLNKTLQQQLLNGEILGATGLSNPMKSFNDLESFNLTHHYNDNTLI